MAKILAMKPRHVRISLVRAAEKDAQRRARQAAELKHPNDPAPVIIQFSANTARRRIDPAERARLALLTDVERKAFVKAVKAYPGAAQGAVPAPAKAAISSASIAKD